MTYYSIRPQTSKVDYDAPLSDRLLALLGISYSDRQKIRPQTSPVRNSRRASGGPLLFPSSKEGSVDISDTVRPYTSGASITNDGGSSLFPAVQGARPSTSPTRQMKPKGQLISTTEMAIDPLVDARPWTAQSIQDHGSMRRNQSAAAVQLSPLMKERDRPSSSAVVRQRQDPKYFNIQKKSRPKTGVRRQRRLHQHLESADARSRSTSFLASVGSFGVGGKKKPLSRK